MAVAEAAVDAVSATEAVVGAVSATGVVAGPVVEVVAAVVAGVHALVLSLSSRVRRRLSNDLSLLSMSPCMAPLLLHVVML